MFFWRKTFGFVFVSFWETTDTRKPAVKKKEKRGNLSRFDLKWECELIKFFFVVVLIKMQQREINLFFCGHFLLTFVLD